MQKATVSILGTEYEIHTDVTPEDDPRIGSVDGFCDTSTKHIKIAKIEESIDSLSDLDVSRKKIPRHEIIHAYMYESGLDCNSEWGRDETLIDWIAIQIPKLTATLTDADC